MTSLVEEPAPGPRAEIDRAYDNSAAFSDVPQWRTTWRERTEAVVISPDARLDVAYGPAQRQKLDIFPCGNGDAPTALFFHGGFWSRNGKETFRFTLRGIHAAGCNAVFAGHTLAPEARMDRIVEEARSAGRWLFGHLGDFGLARRPLFLLGWSSGAHLAAMAMGPSHIAGGIGVSGIYDLAPLRGATLNDLLKLDAEDVPRNTPTLNLPRSSGPFMVAYGARELPAYREQSERFHAARAAAGFEGELLALPGHHHHSVLDELYEHDGSLVRLLARMAGARA
jgi:arylformamidase